MLSSPPPGSLPRFSRISHPDLAVSLITPHFSHLPQHLLSVQDTAFNILSCMIEEADPSSLTRLSVQGLWRKPHSVCQLLLTLQAFTWPCRARPSPQPHPQVGESGPGC